VVGSGTASAQLRLRAVGAEQPGIIKTLAAGDQRLAQGERLLRRRKATAAVLHRDLVEQLGNTERTRQLAHQHKPRVRRHLLRRRSDLDQRRPPASFTFKSVLPPLARTSRQRPC
jgi:hypothetical protein